MRKIEYPAKGSEEWKKLTADYESIFSGKLTDMDKRWNAWKTKHGVTTIPETVKDLLCADARTLADVYDRFQAMRNALNIGLTDGHRGRNPKFKELDEIFKYKGEYDNQIMDFFTARADNLHISSCFYCEMAYINVYDSPRKRQFDVDHFLPKQKCPILGLSLFNFVPSCQVCNSRIKQAKELGTSKSEWEELNPASDSYAFNRNIKIRLRMQRGPDTTFKKKDEYYIHFRGNGVFKKEVDFFHLEERYNFHKSEAIRIKQLKARYPQSARRKIARLLGVSEAQIYEDLFHEKFLKNNYRCFAKMTEDMLRSEKH